ncbi:MULTISPECIES: hypothetical protein [unclassified Flavobacterium]|uniref:hypothetical protein n=1 Tax=unclassified Flavobacterium TaxID=196869 RepID=UPI001F144A9E|nr:MULTISPECIES: hypothetical protein [unclassified Flavobacterium]UMY64832.1 hypothetical protein MKO97_09935 [Flavobacterium sp. HJ-32-4]
MKGYAGILTILLGLLCLSLAPMPLKALPQRFEEIIIGNWQSDRVLQMSAELAFRKNATGTLKWSNGSEDDFTYRLNDSVLKIVWDTRSTKHLISKLTPRTLKLKLNSRKKIKRDKTGKKFVSANIEFVELVTFTKKQ